MDNGVARIKIDQEATALANLQLLTRILNNPIHLPTFMVEAKETIQWLATRASSLHHVITNVKGSKWQKLVKIVNADNEKPPRAVILDHRRKKGYRYPTGYKQNNRLPDKEPSGWSLKPAAERWLEIQWAVKPLISDLAGLMILVYQLVAEKKLPLYRKYGREYREKERTLTLNAQQWPVNHQFFGANSARPTCKLQLKTLIEYRTEVYYTISPTYFEDLGAASLAAAALPAAFEVVPWSWLLDYGITIGDYLSLMDATLGMTFVSGTTSRRLLTRSAETSIDWGGALEAKGESPYIEVDMYERSVIKAFPIPVTVVKNPFSTTHVANVAALLRTKRK